MERKVIVGELDINSSDTKYKNGRVYSLTAQASQGVQIKVEQSERQQIASALKGEIGGFLKIITVGVGMNAEVSRAGTVGTSEQNAINSSRSVLLAVNRVQIDLALKNHKSCLLIRPKINAFEEMLDTHWKWASSLPSNLSEDAISLMRLPYTGAGLLICDEDSSDRLVIPENYYYIHQYFGGHAYEFMSRTIYHNRPYTEIIRGREQMDKFIRSINGVIYHKEPKMKDSFQMKNLIKHLGLDRTQLDSNLIQAFEQNSLDWSGFHKGIYTYPDFINYYGSDTEESQVLIDSMMDVLGNWVAVPEESIYDE